MYYEFQTSSPPTPALLIYRTATSMWLCLLPFQVSVGITRPSQPQHDYHTSFKSSNHIIFEVVNHRKAPEGSASFSAQYSVKGEPFFPPVAYFREEIYSQQGELLLAICVKYIQMIF